MTSIPSLVRLMSKQRTRFYIIKQYLSTTTSNIKWKALDFNPIILLILKFKYEQNNHRQGLSNKQMNMSTGNYAPNKQNTDNTFDILNNKGMMQLMSNRSADYRLCSSKG